ncbi:L-aspartate oxidase [Rickettsiales bacterium]|nr:L-aspartate oxidase [Rickettsiales bacterium]
MKLKKLPPQQHQYIFDFIIIGSGIAGLSLALKLAPYGKIALISKDKINESSSRYAQGGIAAAMLPKDSIKSHYDDTLNAGCYHNKKAAVKILTEEGPARVRELIEYGVKFDTGADNELEFGREAAHSESRILHHKDYTGYEITRNLIKLVKQNSNISIFAEIFIANLIKKNDQIIGCNGFDKEQNYHFMAKATILATGGVASIYQYSSNPEISTGDGIALAIKAGCKLKDMEFMQFHPTGFSYAENKIFLISEATRGSGAKLLNHKYEDFMHKYHKDQELAPRDIVARSIFFESNQGENPIYLDFAALKHNVADKFPKIYQFCLEYGYDLTKDLLPVTPCSHFTMGGVATDMHGRTNIKSLYAIGEVSCNGCHGANRLASNSLLDGLVFAHRASLDIVKSNFQSPDFTETNILEIANNNINVSELIEIKLLIQKIMWENVSLVRTSESLKRSQTLLKAFKFIEKIKSNDKTLIETQNLLMIARKITNAAIRRKISIGSHFIG